MAGIAEIELQKDRLANNGACSQGRSGNVAFPRVNEVVAGPAIRGAVERARKAFLPTEGRRRVDDIALISFSALKRIDPNN